jgi:predicted nucleic acid-binding protein
LAGVGLLALLPALYGSIWVPEAVKREYVAGIRAGDPDLDEFDWISIVSSVEVSPELPSSLGSGEAHATSLAVTKNARAILLDEQLARAVARKRGLPVVGTLGVLIAAKQSGLLVAVKPSIDMMISQRRHISDSLYMQVLAVANEES